MKKGEGEGQRRKTVDGWNKKKKMKNKKKISDQVKAREGELL
jgi:hypothetical protein